MIPFSAETKQGREEIWELIDSLVLPEDGEEDGLAAAEISVQAGVAVEEATVVTQGDSTSVEPEKQRKPRWKASGKETAKKTKKLQEKKAAKTASKSGKKTKKK